MNQNIVRGLVAAGALTLAGASNAALDITAASTAVGDASTAVLAVIALILTMTAGLWAMKKVVALFGK